MLYECHGTHGIEILAIDRGPGMANVAQCLDDGYSSGGTAGNGLGAVQRLSTVFDIFSSCPGGTVVLSRIEADEDAHRSRGIFEWGIVNCPVPHETECGDSWRIAERPGELSLMIVDGLGHGPLAAEAAEIAAITFEEHTFGPTSEFFTVADRRMRGTRGAAMAVIQIDGRAKSVRFTGVGNIAANLRPRHAMTGRGLVSHNGIVGGEMRKVQEFENECPEDALLVMHSDGLQGRWSLEKYSGLTYRHPATIAGVLYRDFNRGRDDVTVCVVRINTSAVS